MKHSSEALSVRIALSFGSPEINIDAIKFNHSKRATNNFYSGNIQNHFEFESMGSKDPSSAKQTVPT